VTDLFSDAADRAVRAGAPLAARMRPRVLEEFFGQAAAVGPGTALRRAIESDEVSSLILYGPAGTGKTSLARIIANATAAAFCELSAVTSGVADLRRAIDEAKQRLAFSSQRTILFIDEIHRFSKSQQDALLHAVEDRLVVLVGATTENPFFEVNAPLISRSRVVELLPLSDEDLRFVVRAALADQERGLGGRFALEPDAEDAIVVMAGGDARVALNALEAAAAESSAPAAGRTTGRISREVVGRAASGRILPYDRDGDVHYDVISAFIKSMRGSDPDAAVYWLARMVQGGEDPKFIARRIMICASEDVGNADPQALLVAHAAFKAAESIGWPEARICLAQAAIYVALAPKSNAAYRAIDSALDEIRVGPARQVPDHLRDRHRPGSDAYGPYQYPHDHRDAWVDQSYLPDGLEIGRFYRASPRGWEARREAERPGRDASGRAAERPRKPPAG
jgi:putative ATPase